MNFEFFLICGGALGLGIVHAFEVDHLAAVSAFVAQRPSPRRAAMFGLQWAAGHGASLLAFGLVLFSLKLTLSPSVAHGLERLVGLALLALGIWTLLQLRASGLHHTHSHNHDEIDALLDEKNPSPGLMRQHTHADGTTHSHPAHGHRHDSLWMGMLHGVAGTAAFAGEALVAVSQTYFMVIGFTLAFSFGVLLAMAVYAGLLGGLLTWGERHLAPGILAARVLTGVWTCGVGIYWFLK